MLRAFLLSCVDRNPQIFAGANGTLTSGRALV
jgi:hypothetical protein